VNASVERTMRRGKAEIHSFQGFVTVGAFIAVCDPFGGSAGASSTKALFSRCLNCLADGKACIAVFES
jgi:hypothetical protein